MYRFDADTHTYWHDDERIPSVSEIIPSPEFFVSEERLEECRLEGEDMHSRIKLYHDTRETWGDPLLVALERWEREMEPVLGALLAWEMPMYNTLFCGTPDMVFEHGMVDFKRQFGNSRRHALQLTGYHILAVNKFMEEYDGDKFLIITFDGTEIKCRDLEKYRDDAHEVFPLLVDAWWARRAYEKYMEPKRRKNGN
jgi:hypothetical protein